MRFFSHEWAASDDEAACRQVVDRYAEMLRTYPPRARRTVTRFVDAFDLRGALLDGLCVDQDTRTVTADIFSGDRRSGYKLLRIVYEDAGVAEDDRRAFEGVLAAKGPQVRFDEFDTCPDPAQRPCCRHRFLFWPKRYGEAAIEFSNLSWTLQPAQERPRRPEG